MLRRQKELYFIKRLGHRGFSPLMELPDYTTRLSCRTKEYRLSRLLSGWPALIEDDHDEPEVPAGFVDEPVVAYARLEAA